MKLRQLLWHNNDLSDQRLKFNDISKTSLDTRQRRSRIIQFYSANNNIGNYTPVLGIQTMLGHAPDTWDCHVTPVDFEYINRNYDFAIIGGAGLLYQVFSSFWSDVEKNCRIPFVIWGIGGCFLDLEPESVVPRRVVKLVAARAVHANLRDTLTAEYYDMPDAHISACPTIEWLHKLQPRRKGDIVLYASHPRMVPSQEQTAILEAVQRSGRKWVYTDNIQKENFGLVDLVRRRYARSDVVVTTRLHGAIIAAGLGVPYVSLAWDDKIRAFQREWGGGILAGSADELRRILNDKTAIDSGTHPLFYEKVREFGSIVIRHLKDERMLP
jgi:hypothetical protein